MLYIGLTRALIQQEKYSNIPKHGFVIIALTLSKFQC